MKITACYITKNEEKTLRRSLESIQDSIDELIIVDTGSTDKTLSIAMDFNAQIYRIAWQDDFAWARNQALEKANGDWILFLDADEYFSSDTKKNIRSVLSSCENTDVLFISMDNVDELSNTCLLTFAAPRIFRNNIGLSYRGRIHEAIGNLQNDVEIRTKYIDSTELKLIHTGYSRDVSLFKVERNLKMLKKELEVSEHPEELYGYLAECYLALGINNLVKKYARLDIARGRRTSTYGSKSWRMLLDVAVKENDRVERKKIAEDAVKKWPEIPEFHAELAECYADEGGYARAIEEASLAIETYKKYDSIEPMKFTEDMVKVIKRRMKQWCKILDFGKENVDKYLQEIAILTQELKQQIYYACTVIVKLCAENTEKARGTLENLKKTLPENLIHVFDCWQYQTVLEADKYEYYMVWLGYIFNNGTEKQLDEYTNIINNFSSKQKMSIGEWFFAAQSWGTAWKVYSMIPQNAQEVDKSFWKHAGICQYRLKNYTVAAECLERARIYNENDPELEAYIVWNERQMKKSV